jgi:hypothetical protein
LNILKFLRERCGTNFENICFSENIVPISGTSLLAMPRDGLLAFMIKVFYKFVKQSHVVCILSLCPKDCLYNPESWLCPLVLHGIADAQ